MECNVGQDSLLEFRESIKQTGRSNKKCPGFNVQKLSLMTRFTCTNCGYSVDSMHPGEKDLSCPGCRHCFEKDGEDGCEIQEHDHIFFEELMSGRTDEQFYPGELLELPARQGTQDRETAEVTERPRLQHRLRFKGSAGGYFRIWVGNVLLSVMTLGIFMLRSKKES